MRWRLTACEIEETADACAMLASSEPHCGLSSAIDGYYSMGYELALEAWLSVSAYPWAWTDEQNWRERWAEAEARLRCGWLPGDRP